MDNRSYRSLFDETVDPNFSEVDTRTDTEYHLCASSDLFHISWERSTSKLDWIYNLHTWTVECCADCGLRIHKGFLSKWLAVKAEIFAEIEMAKPEFLKLRGFSQGAAIATLAHLFVKKTYPDIELDTVIFGAPAVFHRDSVEEANVFCSDILRIDSAQDIVPHLTLGITGHIGQWVHIGEPWAWWKIPLGFYRGDHSIEGYKRATELADQE